jgi:hypothetical protein
MHGKFEELMQNIVGGISLERFGQAYDTALVACLLACPESG